MKLFTFFKKSIFLLSVAVLLSVAFTANAAQMYFGVQDKQVGVDAKFEVGVFLNTDQQSVNAIEGQIVFPADLLEFKGFYNGSSIVNFWVQQPKLTSSGIISFSGIAPGGYTGSRGYLFSALFTAKRTGSVNLATAGEKILLNDGSGSEAAVRRAPLVLTINPQAAGEPFVPLYDATPPDNFDIQVSKDSNIFDGKWFLTFATQDKGSGIESYQVMEKSQKWSFRSFFENSSWVSAESPYVVVDQKLQHEIYVKAIDKAGNEKVSVMTAPNAVSWYENYIIWIVILALAISSSAYALWRHIKSRK